MQLLAIAGTGISAAVLGLFPLSLCNPGAMHLLSQGSVPGEGPLIFPELIQASQQQKEVEAEGCKIAFIIMIST